MTKQQTTGTTIIVIALFLLTCLLGGIQAKEEQLFIIIGKLESDADYCLTTKDINIIKDSKLSEEYKNYLFEIDYNNPRCK